VEAADDEVNVLCRHWGPVASPTLTLDATLLTIMLIGEGSFRRLLLREVALPLPLTALSGTTLFDEGVEEEPAGLGIDMVR
jgi:hypothetical protein